MCIRDSACNALASLQHPRVWGGDSRVGNIWFLNPLVLSKWEDLAFSVCMLFEESVLIFQFLNNKMHNYVLFNTFVHFFIQKLKNKHIFLKTEKAKFSRRENLVFILFWGNCGVFFQFFNDKSHNCVLFAIIVHFNIQKLKNKHTFIQTEKAKSSHFDRTRGDKKQIFPT